MLRPCSTGESDIHSAWCADAVFVRAHKAPMSATEGRRDGSLIFTRGFCMESEGKATSNPGPFVEEVTLAGFGAA